LSAALVADAVSGEAQITELDVGEEVKSLKLN
jgi:hypothetical protein